MAYGMYSTRYINKNKVDGNAFISVGDAYKDPPRFLFRQPKKGEKVKTFRTDGAGKSGQTGNFTKVTYVGSKYQEANLYINSQPLADRKNGFGTHDARRRDEFSNATRTEQYRDALKKEKKRYTRSAEEAATELAQLEQESASFKKTMGKSQFTGPEHNFDLGRTRINEYNIKSKIDTFYRFDNDKGKHLGSERPVSGDYGAGAWDYGYSAPKFGGKSSTKTFLDKSHLKVGA